MGEKAAGSVGSSEIQESEALELVGGGRLGMCEISTEGQFRSANDELCRILGRSASELRGEWVADVTHPEDRGKSEEALARVIERGEPVSIDKRYLHSDGSVVSASSILTRLEDERGRPRGVLAVTIDLTERLRIIKALQESERRYRMLFRTIEQGFCVLDILRDESGRMLDGRLVECNPKFAEQTGLDFAAGRTLRELVPGLRDAAFEEIDEVARTGCSKRVEEFVDDSWFDVYAFQPGSREEGRVALLLDNITERKRRELHSAFLDALLAELSQLFTCEEVKRWAAARIADHLGVASVAFADATEGPDRIRAVAYRAGPQRGSLNEFIVSECASEEHAAELRAGRIIPIDDVREHPLTRCHAEAYIAREVFSQILAPHFSEGRWKFLLILQGGAPRSWRADEIGLAQELSGRLWQAIERAYAEEALRESEGRFRMALSAADMGMWSCDLRDGALSYDARSAEMFGLPSDDRIDLQWLLAERVHPGDAETVNATLRRAREPDSSGRYRVEFRVRLPEGAERWILSYGGVFFQEYEGESSPSKMIGIGLDITERKRAEQRLRDNDRRKDEFLATLAHELRNPLAPLDHGLEILRRTEGLNPAVAPLHAIMARQVRHMVRLVDDLLEVSRITRGKIELRTERVDLRDVLRTAVDASGALVEDAGHELFVHLPEEPLVVDADAVRLTQVFGNLLNNAAKYTDPGGEIRLDARQEGGTVVVSVRDTGVGIPAEMLAHVFDMFTQVDRAAGRSQGGLGIGLTLVKSLVRMHGGSVEARSGGKGEGAEFLVRLKLAEPRPPAHSGDGNSRALHEGHRILVVDDNRDAADSLGALLVLVGAEVRVLYDGPSTLAVLEEFRPTAALVDLGMPGMDGLELARRMQEHPHGRSVHLIALTGWGQEEDRRRTREAGFEHHLVKPAEIEPLRRLLHSLEV